MADKKIKQNYITSINLDTNLITLTACLVTKDMFEMERDEGRGGE